MVKKMSGNETAPKQGDLIWIDAEPHAGHEYGGHDKTNHNIRRPMLVISSDIYNQRTGMIVGFPITSQILHGFPGALKIESNKVHGYAVLTHLLGYDYSARSGEVVDHLSKALKQQALSAVKDIFDILD
ncbi:type II toxin-antitoxin system PemK/MazF family toxin [Lactiplantibacillus pentosus]|uniref:type II toxin-antitoxin system PemK/MazF family toxin n=1 Tax=Lactiplantibacillus pentosus TaxID=1589 RepID=UPI001E347ECB|nr:type II toxin-antitoxin system PemK/MazF family toxin [Lactiplantibacillus pentosus]MDO7803706.1 type II toxin-antitoxin system PemK/MazF family toxin [Lactiplantibacillus pentosus]